MKKQLFFDDNKLFGRDNTIRKYGKPELISVYYDGIASTDGSTGYVFQLDNGKYRMLYAGYSTEYSDLKLFSAISENGVDFAPETLFDLQQHPEKAYPHELMQLKGGWEVACIYEDEICENPQERYKLLMSEHDGIAMRINDAIYTSPDLIHWSRRDNVFWADSAEPLAGVFYNKHKKVHTILERPFWGIRCVGYKETKDFETFTEYRECLNVDSCDGRLDEIYGMRAFEYDGMYIGLPQMYRHLNSELNAKYKNGIIDTQLAYSYDGTYWRRSLREPFISGLTDDGVKYNLVWIPCMRRQDDGSILFYGSASEYEHGPAFHNPGTGRILIYKLRNDGFISLSSANPQEVSTVATREKIWHGGELHINLKAKKATAAVYLSDDSEFVFGNVLGIAKPVEGYTHEDCIPFCGDSTDWVPAYTSGKTLHDLREKTLVFELKFENGEVFSFSGDYTDVFNTQAARYRKFGILPDHTEKG